MGQFIWVVFLVLIFFLQQHFAYSSLSISSFTDNKNRQKLALFQFKLSLRINPVSWGGKNGYHCIPPQPKTVNWSMSSDHCTWDGVTCNDLTGDVIGIDLSCSQLVGPILPNSTLFHLSHLQTLDLSGNDFSLSPQILREFGRFAGNLMHLDLSYCGFSGKIPSEIAHLHKLVSLDLSSSSPVLSLEHELFKFLLQNSTRLRDLYLDGVDISSILPTNLSSSLRILDLSLTGLHGELPEEVFHLPNLESLILDGNTNLSVKLPKVKWGSSSTLTLLLLGGLNISGGIPDAIEYLRSISFLSLGDNNLNGPFPSSIVGLRELVVLDLGNNSLSGPLPPNLTGSGLQKLRTLSLSNNLLNGTIPSWLFALPSLHHLDLNSNMLTGQLDEYQYSTSLTAINCNNNTLFGFIPRFILELVNLTSLDLSSNNITGALEIDMFSRLKNLNYLDLSNNQIHGQIPRLVGSTWGHSLRYVDLSHNFLTGDVEQLQWKNLIYSNLRTNMLNRSLSWSICNSSSLEILNLSHNNLSGVLPHCPGHLNYSLYVLC